MPSVSGAYMYTYFTTTVNAQSTQDTLKRTVSLNVFSLIKLLSVSISCFLNKAKLKTLHFTSMYHSHMHFTYGKDKEFIKCINIFNLPYNLYPMTEERGMEI